LASHAASSIEAALEQYPLLPETTTSKKKSPIKPAAAGSSKIQNIDPLPLTIPLPAVGNDLRKTAMTNHLNRVIDAICVAVCENSDTVPDEPAPADGEAKRRWGRLPAYLAKAGLYITNYPVRGVLPGLGGGGQGVRGLGVEELKTLALSLSAEGGDLQLHRGNATGMLSLHI
jgi:hypothetical protein